MAGDADLVIAGFGGWTLFVWGGRLRNLWIEPGGLGAAGRWSLLGAVGFTALGGAVVGSWVCARLRRSPRLGRFAPLDRLTSAVGSAGARRLTVLALAALTVAVWSIRAVEIATDDHPVGFIAVHVVLAVVSIGLAVLAARRVIGGADDRSAPSMETSPVG